MSDRIDIAEAMGLLPEEFADWDEYRQALGEYSGEVRRILLALIPDPFTDANADYAVLEWMRGAEVNGEFFGVVSPHSMWAYQIGNYANRALEVLK